MSGAAVKIGPFTGGMNTYSDPTAIGDNEALEITNFDIDIDGSLVTRPPFTLQANTPGNFTAKLLGWFKWTDGTDYLIASLIDTSSGTPTNTVQFNASTGLWTTITGTFAATAMVQYANKAWLIADPTETDPGGSWDPVAGFTAVSAMKKGRSAAIYKERLFIGEGSNGANSSRLYFSVPATFTSWNSSDFVDVKSGDGQSIVDLKVYADTIVIFKENSTYIFAYDSKPSAGQVRVISGSIGVADRDCVVEYENNLYLLHKNNVYSVINWNYSKLNLKVPFQYINSYATTLVTPQSVSLIGDRLVIRYYDMYYVWGMKTRVWVQWKSTNVPPLGKFFTVPSLATGSNPAYYATGQLMHGASSATAMYEFKEEWNSVDSETFDWKLVTKSYDFESPYTFKRLFWWGVDVIAKGAFTSQVYPVFYGNRITWNAAALRTWDQAAAFTWDRGDTPVVTVNTSTNISGTSSRTFVKLMKALRFRQVTFSFFGTSTGRNDTSPMRIFGVTIFADSKQKVVAQVT